MAIKINLMPKREGEDGAAGGESRRPFYFLIVFVFFIISFLVYFGIYYYNNFFLKKQLDTIEKKSADIQKEISESATAEELAAAAAVVIKGKSIRSILSDHIYASKIYELLEKLTIKSVSYNKFSEKSNSDNNTITVSVSGEADSFNALAKQLVIFKKTKEIKEIIFKEASSGKNAKVIFSVVLNFDSKLVTVRPVITLFGPSLIEIIVGSDYSDAGAVAVDGVDGPVAVTTTGSVNTSVVGTYTLVYNSVNAAGNSAILTRTVNVAEPQSGAVSK